jgi:hypothetical protein
MKILAINLKNLDLSYFTKRGLDIEVEHAELHVKFPLKFLYTTINGDMFTPDIHDHLNLNYNKHEYSFILYGYPQAYYGDALKSTGGYAHHTAIKSGTYWASVRLDGNENAYAVHEIHHLLCYYINLTLKDITPKDFMDYTPVNGMWVPYYLNHDPGNPLSNHAQTWNNIKKFLPQLNNITYIPPMPVVVLKRGHSDDKQQLGDLTTKGFTAKTMELSYKNNAKNISAIPKGTYTCKWTFSPRFMRYTYEVLNVPNRTGIRFHEGNYFFQINGCVMLGTHFTDLNKDRHADLANSRKTIKAFEQHMGKKDFILQII